MIRSLYYRVYHSSVLTEIKVIVIVKKNRLDNNDSIALGFKIHSVGSFVTIKDIKLKFRVLNMKRYVQAWAT